MAENEIIQLEKASGIAKIILSRPPDNRMGTKFFTELSETVLEIKKDQSLKAVVIHSSGRHFSAGADVEDIKNNVSMNASAENNTNELVYRNAAVLRELETLDIPVIAAINGFCTGSGLELALACDIRVCSTDAFLGCPELSFGIITGLSGSIRLEKTAGRSRAKEIILRGDLISANEAYKIGVVDIIKKKKELLPFVLKLASIYAEASRYAANKEIKKRVMNV